MSCPELHVETESGTRQVAEPDPAQRLTEVLRRQGLPLNTRCGQHGVCDGCLVELVEGALTGLDGAPIEAAAGPATVRACEVRAGAGRAKIVLPARSLLVDKPLAVSDFHVEIGRGHDPLTQRRPVPADGDVDGLRIDAAVRPDSAAPPTGPEAELAYRGDHWIARAPRVATAGVGAAVDIGTTTVAVLLVDLADGEILGRASAFNRQMHLGDDVLTRINLCMTDPPMIGRMRAAVCEDTLVPLLEQALAEAGREAGELAAIAAAGNTTMLHLVAGVDPTPMGTTPFTPQFLEHRCLEDFSFAGRPIDLHLLPGAAAYIGSDLTAGVIATGMRYRDATTLLVDVGTNGEILLHHEGRLYGCATAAGPAFEGAKLASGMRASDGAIRGLRIGGDPLEIKYDMIGPGGGRPTGLCGSAYVDFLAEARAADLVSATGRIDPKVAGRWLIDNEHGRAVRVARARGSEPLMVSDRDIASLVQAKAAIAAGILTLIERAGLTPERIETLYLAGGFGMHMHTGNAIRCGLLPGFSLEQVELVGNTSLAGALLALTDSTVMNELGRAGTDMEVLELNTDPGFEARFIDQLALEKQEAPCAGSAGR